MYYVFIQDNKINGVGQCRQLTQGVLNIEVSKEVYDDIERYIWNGEGVVLDPNYEEKQAQKERERLAQEIKTKLYELDLKTIRPLRASETQRLQELENEAERLREQLSELLKG